ncbi:ribonuclease H-like domain-containing protein [Tanacetum coccineum]
MCDKKNNVLFNDTECIVLSLNFKLTDESHVLLKVPRKNNTYSVDLKNIVPKIGLTCLFAKDTSDESKLWHRRLGHINFKTMNKLVRGNLVRGLPSKLFKDNQTSVACQNEKQHRASYQRVKVIRCDNGTEFKNKVMNQFYERKSIKREFSVARTPQQNGVAERKNRTLIEAARTMLVDSKLPTTFWAEAVNTAYYVQNRVLVTKPHNKTLYELFLGRKPALGFMKPFRCLVTILNTIALVDGKKIVITESTIRRDLQLEDAKGTDCLPNATIFEQLTLMGAKTTTWNKFSSTMASAIICLAINQKFNFSKYILESIVKNLENVSGKFLMYPRFVQVFVNQQVGDMSNHKRIYVTPSHTKKIFGNMKREGKGFSGRVTLLFPTMMVQAQEEMGEGPTNLNDPHHTPIITQP